MHIILLIALVGNDSCLTALYNMWQIGDALQYKPNMIITFISLINFWNFTERVLCGFISEKLVMKYKVPRPLMLSAVLFFSCNGLLLPLRIQYIWRQQSLVLHLVHNCHWFCPNFRHLWPQALLHFVQLWTNDRFSWLTFIK
jgi:hypothetical protein